MKLIMLGAPGAGKGTQAEIISEKYGIPTISTGNIIREAIKNQTEMGKAAKVFIDKGQLVPDDVVIQLVVQRIANDDCSNGFILDGFPRTLPQAEALDNMGIIISKVIDLEVSDENITQRISGRRVCEVCGASYHINYKPSQVEGICDKCGGKTVLRDDDKPETVLERLRVYHKQTEPLKEYYSAQNKLYTVYGQEDVNDTSAMTLKAVEA
ncbi:adenylate kinase [Paludicola sp. MB14-C6]|uniref:adenylate kinase n=1 Tax=Paludihabitans sp. MB14-C6 TaxID=3070656 RepID=UPI0027DDDB0A|nr:adenylate kinase [Paludicola sp. MB14-C6]WMJ24163.1 adenylate kinase [Paludicola sp. MB14-C6]